MYRFLFIFFALFCTGFFISETVAAQDTTSSSTISSTTVETPVKRNLNSEPALKKIAQTRLTNLAANMSNRMDATTKRLQNVIDRLNSRLNKMTEAGLNVDAARNSLNAAQTKLDLANKNLVTIDIEVNAFIGATTPRENWSSLKSTFITTKDTLIAAHLDIITVIKLAKEATATPTIATTTATTSIVNN